MSSSKDEFFKDRYETPDRETVLEAENKRLKEMTQGEYAKNLLIKNDRLNVENAALKARIEELEKQHFIAIGLLYPGSAINQSLPVGADENGTEAFRPTPDEAKRRYKI